MGEIMVLIYAWVLFGDTPGFQGPLFAFTTVHALQSAVLDDSQCNRHILRILTTHFTDTFLCLWFIVFLFSKRDSSSSYRQLHGIYVQIEYDSVLSFSSCVRSRTSGNSIVIAGIFRRGFIFSIRSWLIQGRLSIHFTYNHKLGRIRRHSGKSNMASGFYWSH